MASTHWRASALSFVAKSCFPPPTISTRRTFLSTSKEKGRGEGRRGRGREGEKRREEREERGKERGEVRKKGEEKNYN